MNLNKKPLSLIKYSLLFVLIIWCVYIFEVSFGYNFTKWGIKPKDLDGLKGVLFSPWIHSDIQHLYNNTIPLFLLSTALYVFYKKHFWWVVGIGIIASGLITWGIGRPAYHIGASGLIYVLASFLFFKGVVSRYYRLIALSLSIVFFYGSMIWYVFPVKEGMSWEGHLAGLIVGALLSLLIKLNIKKEAKYEWQREDYDESNDLFLQHFDEKGRFIPNRFDPPKEEEVFSVKYWFVPSEEDASDL